MTVTIIPPVTKDDFWATLESAWHGIEDDGARARLVDATLPHSEREEAAQHLGSNGLIDKMLANLKALLLPYSSERLHEWDTHLERAQYDIDREDVHEALDGSDDGFLYNRGFVVACGKKYYDAVNKEPGTYGLCDFDAEEMCYFPMHLWNEKTGEYPDWPRSGISRESNSNAAGWS
ncbi:uncharacterized protein EHS24_000231 [Apiotrichum porosum]|uniref:DUF4240 domain-containing protein n=1 Tax=Apiotrichum porosum TaxID=105984 RepID=A0A427Y9M2_9TREE|nr:uncharacterized protein EHS24_000231 [Apiotrichum porosum]RSH87715.1 hypothetical protein EHS24_000231 [Apiotrichum porosum]